MNALFNRLAIASLSFATLSTVSQAAEIIVLKPLHGISFKAGQASSVGYFQADHGSCKLVLTYTGDTDSASASSFTVNRYEAVIGSGETVRHAISDQPYEFACHANAGGMTLKALNRFASAE